MPQRLTLDDIAAVEAPDRLTLDDIAQVEPAPTLPSLRPMASHVTTLPPMAAVPSHTLAPPPQPGVIASGVNAFGRALVAQPAEALASTLAALGLVSDDVRANVARRNQVLANPIDAAPLNAETLSDPRWWASVGGQTLGSIASLLTAGGLLRKATTGAGTALKLAPKAMAALERAGVVGGAAAAESWLEAGLGYSEAREAGASPEQAAITAAKQFAMNLPITAIGNIPVLDQMTSSRVLNALIAAASEGAQEGAQEVAGNVAAQTYDPSRPATANVGRAALIGALAGGPANLALNAGQPAPTAERPVGLDLGAVPFERRAETPTSGAVIPGNTQPSTIGIDDIAAVEPSSEGWPDVSRIMPSGPLPARPPAQSLDFTYTDDLSPENIARLRSLGFAPDPEGSAGRLTRFVRQAPASAPEAAAPAPAPVSAAPEVTATPTPTVEPVTAPAPAQAVPAPPQELGTGQEPAGILEALTAREEDDDPLVTDKDRDFEAAITAPVPAKFADLPRQEQVEVRRILVELENFQHEGRIPVRDGDIGRIEGWVPTQSNAPVYHAINANTRRSSKAIRAAISRYLEGGKRSAIIDDVVRVARERAYLDPDAYGAMLPREAGYESGPAEIEPPAGEDVDFNFGGNLSPEDAARAPIEFLERGQPEFIRTPELEAADAAYKQAFDRDREITAAYRAGRVGNDEFLAARKAFEAARDAYEAAERNAIKQQPALRRAGRGRPDGSLERPFRSYEDAGPLFQQLQAAGETVRIRNVRVSGGPLAFVIERKPAGGWWKPIGGPSEQADLLSTGEQQPRLPGDVGDVRDQEVAQPKLGDVEYSLEAQTDERRAVQETLFGAPVKPAAPTKTKAPRASTDQGALFERADTLQASLGSPTRALYQPGTTPKPWRGGRPLSEQEAVNRLRGIFSVPRVTPSYLRSLFGEAKAAYPVRFRKVPAGAFGTYNTQTGIIRLKKAFDLTTFAHEAGHMLSFRMFGDSKPDGLYKGEILTLGKNTAPKSAPPAIRFEEGIAEYFRVWFADPAEAARQAPAFTQALNEWLSTHRVADAQLHAAQAVIQRYNAQPAAVRGRARVNVQPSGIADRAREVAGEMKGSDTRGFVRRVGRALRDTGNLPALVRDPHRWFDNLVRTWFDRHRALQQAVVNMAATTGKADLDPAESAYVLTRLAEGSSGMAEGFLDSGVRGRNGKKLGPSLKEALAPVRHRLYPQGERTEPDFVTYLTALRALELHKEGRGRWPGISPEEAVAIVTETHADPEAKTFAKAARDVHAYLKALREYAASYGLISPDLKARLDEALFYVPLQRVLDETTAELNGGGSNIANRGTTIKRLKGSGRDIIDPIESIVKNTEALVSAVQRNRAAQALVRQATRTPNAADWLVEVPPDQIATRFNLQQLAPTILKKLQDAGVDIAEALPGKVQLGDTSMFDELVTVFTPTAIGNPGERIVTVIQGGERRFYQVQDEALYQNIANLGPQATTELVKWAAKPTAMLRAGATLRPSFIVRNLLRDTVGAMMQSRHGFIPIYDSMRGLLSQIRRDEDFQRFQAFGVQSSTLLGQDRARVKEFIDSLTAPSAGRAKVKFAAHPLQFLRYLSEQIEVATRLGEFKLAMENRGGDRRVGLLGIGQRLMDAARPGDRPDVTESRLTRAALTARDVTIDFARGGTTAKELSQFKAFFNARVQGYVRIAETVQRDPVGAALTVGALAALGAALWALNHDDPEYQEIPAQQKRDYWFIRLPGVDWFLTVPKPFQWALVPNIVEAALDETVDAEDVLGLGDFLDVVLLLTPTGLLPFLEAGFNYDSYRRRPIVSPADAGKDPDLQAREWTSETARVLADPIGVSPAKLEHVAFGLGGGLARDAAGLIDPILEDVSDRDRPARAAKPWTSLVPGAEAIVRPSAVNSSAQSIQDFYEVYAKYQQRALSLRDRRKGEGRRDTQNEIRLFVRDYPEAAIARLKAAKAAMDDLRERLAAVRGSDRTPEQKAADEAAIYETMTTVARRGLGRPPLDRPSRRDSASPDR